MPLRARSLGVVVRRCGVDGRDRPGHDGWGKPQSLAENRVHVRRLRSLPALAGLGRGLAAIARDKPDGLLRDERCLYAWNHVGTRQYWRDPDSLEAFTRAEPHATWWRDFLRDQR